jgi:GT2 family glycosyltransferase
MPEPDPPRVVAVVVAYNRAELLGGCLTGLAGQTRPLDAVVVVDNASSDASGEVARTHPVGADVVGLPRNTGGAGGFAAGIAHAVARHSPDLVWLMDDDTIPTPTALAELLAARDGYDGPVTALGSRVVWTDGRDHPMNTPRRRPGASPEQIRKAEAVGAVPVRSISFVSLLIDAGAIRDLGLPVADYFIWNDDFEYSARLLRRGTGLFVPASVVEHRTKVLADTDVDPGPRFYNEVRNKLWLLLHSKALSPPERVLYLGASLRRWLRTFLKSGDRGTLVRSGAKGVRDGLGYFPRGAAESLAGLGPVSAEVSAVASGAPVPAPPPPADGFSVLLPVYAGDSLEHLRRSVDSITVDQTLPPDEVVIVQDGPVATEVSEFLDELACGGGKVPVTLVRLERNVGLAGALGAGLERCGNEIVARADADDISLPRRFELQVPLIRGGLDLVGAAIVEFGEDERDRGIVRTPPLLAEDIGRYARFHDPFNHPSVVYRRSAVQRVGGYRPLPLMEDYLLFARMIAGGAAVANVAEPLVLYRIGAGAYGRRGGTQLLRSELALQRELLREGFTRPAQFARNVVLRGGYRLVPEDLRRRAYRALVLKDRSDGD